MKRLIVVAVICTVFFLALHGPASAMAEVCPATLHYRLVPQPLPSATFGFELRAEGTGASIAFDHHDPAMVSWLNDRAE